MQGIVILHSGEMTGARVRASATEQSTHVAITAQNNRPKFCTPRDSQLDGSAHQSVHASRTLKSGSSEKIRVDEPVNPEFHITEQATMWQ
jgi:hypothetical protein